MVMLAEILSSRVRAEIFRLLFGINPIELHMREMTRRAGFTIGTIQTELKKLNRLGLVTSRRDGNRLYYKAQQAHPLYPDIRNLVLKTAGLADVLRQALAPSDQIRIAFVFGSLARQEDTAGSDVDVMIIGKLGLRDVTGLLASADVADRISREINPYVLTAEEFNKRKSAGDHFVTQLIDSPKIFIVGSQNELEAMG